jgi:hypothetical protein
VPIVLFGFNKPRSFLYLAPVVAKRASATPDLQCCWHR